jgi:hypothetical protein
MNRYLICGMRKITMFTHGWPRDPEVSDVRQGLRLRT